MATETDRRDEIDFNPYITLIIGATVGVALLIGSVVLFYYGWTPLVDWIREGKRDKLWEPMAAILLALLGEGTMFVAFQSARKVERRDASLRRILYGYNAVFTSHLLFLLLLLVNVFVYVRYPSPIDTTAGGFYSLSEMSKKFIEGLERPVTVYMILDQNYESYSSMQTMLTEMQKTNPKYFSYEEVSPDPRDPLLRQLASKFAQFGRRAGLIVALGNEPEKNHTFISADELSGASFDPEARGAQRRQFNGEVRLMQELLFLADEKKKPILYFTQGHGEPDLNGQIREEDLGTLRQRLTAANYDVRPLVAGTDAEKFAIPEDAEVVVIVGPTKSMADMLPALRSYMEPSSDPKKKKGKLLVFLGPTPIDRARANAMTETGLEGLLREFSVEVTGEQVLAFAYPRADKFQIAQNPQVVLVGGTKEAVESQHPLAQMLKEQPVSFYQVRQIRPGGGQNPSFRPEVVIGTDGLVWSESNMQLARAPIDQLRMLLADARLREQRLTRDALPVVVAVTEGPVTPHGFGQPSGRQTPRLMVVGCSSMAGNDFQLERTGGIHFDMVKGCIEWSRERYAAIGVEPKTHQYFMLPAKVSWWMLAYLPWLAMLLFIAGFGVIVWTVRRR